MVINASNELTSTSNGSYTYDSDGNTLTDSAGRAYTWDFENRLTQVTMPGGSTVQFKYDPFGRRIEKSSGGGATIYAYDGDNVVESTDQTGAVVSRFAQGEGIDEPLAELQSGTINFYEADGLGSITSLTNFTGSLAQTYTYDSFGNTSSSGGAANPFQYTAREFDSETGLSYYRARYYDPSGGRFLSADPVGFAGGINLYRYAINSVANGTDPSGLWSGPAHDQLIWNAFHDCKGISNEDIYRMQQGSRSIDKHYQDQDPAHSYMHAMRDGTTNQSPADAEQETASFIATETRTASGAISAGDRSTAMFVFGEAMHPVMDVTSPAHTDANGDPIPWCGVTGGCSQTHLHGGDEFPDYNPLSIERIRNLTPTIQEEETTIMRLYYQLMTGQKLDCECGR